MKLKSNERQIKDEKKTNASSFLSCHFGLPRKTNDNYLNASDFLIVKEFIRPLFEMKMLIMMFGLLEVHRVVRRFEQPERRPSQLVAVVSAFVIQGCSRDRFVIKAAISIGKLVQFLSVFQTFVAVFRIVAAENYAGCSEGSSGFACEVRSQNNNDDNKQCSDRAILLLFLSLIENSRSNARTYLNIVSHIFQTDTGIFYPQVKVFNVFKYFRVLAFWSKVF